MTAISARNTRHTVTVTTPVSDTRNIVDSTLVAGATAAGVGLAFAVVGTLALHEGYEPTIFSGLPEIFGVNSNSFHHGILFGMEFVAPISGAIAGIYNYVNNKIS